MVEFSVAIIAGGKSSRMGRDKGLLPFGNATMVEYIWDQVKEIGGEHFLVSNKPQDYEQFGLPVYEDVIPDIGALGGIYTSLHYASQPYCLLLACDMPFVNLPLIEFMVDLASQHDLVIPQLAPEEYAEPFRALYSKACLPAIETAIADGKRRVISFFPAISIRYIEREEIHRFDPTERSFFNINTPQELEMAIKLANMGE